MAFSEQTLAFLFENRMHDSRAWYQEHKNQYQQYVAQPCKALIQQVQPYLAQIDPQISCTPRCMSRIYRDARFSKDKSLFRTSFWCTFSRPRDGGEYPAFYFEAGQERFSYGCGFYHASTVQMQLLRQMILEQSPSYLAARQAMDSQQTFSLYGELYKRNHFPDAPSEQQDWLNRRNMGASCQSTDFPLLFSDALPQVLGEGYVQLTPFYRFLLNAAEQA